MNRIHMHIAHEYNSPTGVLTEGDDLDGLFLPDEPVSDACLSSTALLSDYRRKIRTTLLL